MKHIPSPEENPLGLHTRYRVEKYDGTQVDQDAEYFVLRLDYGGDDHTHVTACRVAIMTYADEIAHHLPQLAADIRQRYGAPYSND
jgi:hypothetical protein